MNLEIKEQPYNEKLEADILGMLILEPKRLRELKDKVKVNAFFSAIHIEIYTAMLYLFNKNIDVSYYTIMDRLVIKDGDGKLDYLLDLANSVASTVSFDNKVDILNDLYYKRTLQKEAEYLLTTNLESISSDDLVKRLKDKIEGMGVVSNIEYDRLGDYADEWVAYQEDETPVETMKLGFKVMDEIVLLEKTNFMIIASRPSVGKSAYATNITKNLCMQGNKTLFVSLEMSKKEVMNRYVSNLAKVRARKLKRKEHKTSDEWQRIMSANDKIKKWDLNVYDKGGMHVEQLRGLARYLKQKNKLDVIVVDYLQLLDTHQYKNQKANRISYISQQLKQIAMELEIVVIALAQINRGAVDNGVPREPQLSDLKDSGSLEEDANIVLMLHTNDLEQKFQEKKYIKVFVRKNRDGRLGTVNYTYYGDFINFVEKDFDRDTREWKVVEQDTLLPDL